MRKTFALDGACVALLTPNAAGAAPPSPFDHACAEQHGVQFCPTTFETVDATGTANQKGALTWQLNGGGWKSAKGHTVELEVLGQDPNYLRKSNGKFSVTVSRLTASLPTREKRPA